MSTSINVVPTCSRYEPRSAALLHMLCGYLGEDRFRAGVASFLGAHAYDVAGADELWHALSGTDEVSVGELMSPWLDTPGHPRSRWTSSTATW